MITTVSGQRDAYNLSDSDSAREGVKSLLFVASAVVPEGCYFRGSICLILRTA